MTKKKLLDQVRDTNQKGCFCYRLLGWKDGFHYSRSFVEIKKTADFLDRTGCYCLLIEEVYFIPEYAATSWSALPVWSIPGFPRT